MMFLKKIVLLFTICSATLYCFAQQLIKHNEDYKYRAVHWTIEDGLSQGEVYSLIKDVKGFLWIGTQYGLNRFDGSSFKNYFADKDKKNKTIIGNGINGMIEDSLHNIWIGTDKGLSRYDIRADTFRNFPSKVSGQAIVPFWATKNEIFCWDYPDSQLAAININSFAKRTLVKLEPTDTAGYATSDMHAIFDPLSNSVWLEKGLPSWAGGIGGGLLQISLSNGKREDFRWSCYIKIPNHSHFSEGMKYDRSRNSIWISSPDGLLEFRFADKKFYHVDELNESVKLKDFIQWAGIDIDSLGRIWVGTHPKGIFIYNPITHIVTKPFPDDSIQQENVSDDNVFIYCDKHGIVWSGFWARKGIYQILPFYQAVTRYTGSPSKSNSLSDNQIYNCVNAEHGKVWLGTGNGLNTFDPMTGIFQVFREKDLPGFTGKTIIVPISVDSISHKAWISNHLSADLFEMDITTKKCRKVIFNDSPDTRQFMFCRKYKNGCAVRVNYADQQDIFIVHSDSLVAERILSFPGNTITLFNSIDNQNLLFIRRSEPLTNLTYLNLNRKWIQVRNPLDSIGWSSVAFSSADQTYWVVAEKQLIHYNQNFKEIHRYGREDGLPEIELINIIADNKGNIWFNTDRSIFLLNVNTGIITKLSDKDGFQKQNFVNTPTPLIKDVFGFIYFPCGRVWGEGFDRIDPESFKESYPPSSTYIQSLRVNQNEFPVAVGINNVEQLSFKHFQNEIAIETGVIDYYSNGKNNIRYKLKEVNENWQYAPAYYTIRYDGLPAGKYTLLIQASNAVNEFNGPVKSLLIKISPAFWNTLWFRIAATFFVIVLIYGLMRRRLFQKFRLQLERSEKEKRLADIGQKAAELEKQKTELEMQALRAQMNPHFIFNSLNSINRFILQNNKTQASEYLTKFSKLVRLILQNSQAPLITLESELESLELYLSLEALRFNYHFDYKVSVPSDLDISMLKVPPLIIQPYVENAIWHGLMHKEEKGQLDIEVSQENDHLYFKITDNGVGRKQSAAMASKSATKHKSMGLRITAHRIAMMQSSGTEESPMIINDLTEPDGTAAGTEIIIKMPVIYD